MELKNEIMTTKDELRERIAELEAAYAQATVLYRVGQSLACAPLQPREIAETIARQFIDVFGVQECSIQLYHPQDETMHILFEGKTLETGPGNPVYDISKYPTTARLLETLQPLVVHASDTDEQSLELQSSGEWNYIKEYNIATLAIVPMIVDGCAIGVIEFDAWHNEHRYSEKEMNLAMALANQAAVALENARLHETVEQELGERERAEEALQEAHAEMERQVEERTAELQREIAERERMEDEHARLQQEIIEGQKNVIRELSTPVIPVMSTPRGSILVIPLIGSIDDMRARDITRALLAGIREHRAKVVILDITGVPLVDSNVAAYLTKSIQAARLKGANTIISGISDAVAETIVDLGIDWNTITTLRDLQTGLLVALDSLGIKLTM